MLSWHNEDFARMLAGVDGYSGGLDEPAFRLSPLDRLLAVADHALRALDQHAAGGAAEAGRGATGGAARRRRAAPRRRADARQPRRRGLRAGALQRAGARHAPTRRCGASSSTRPREETDHLAWTARAARASSARGRACSIRSGMQARSASAWSPAAPAMQTSLGFVVETERQVERHLDEPPRAAAGRTTWPRARSSRR